MLTEDQKQMLLKFESLTKEQRELLTQLAKTMNEQPPVKKRGLFG